jgi:hypothetical protein
MLEPDVCRVLEAVDAEAGLRLIGADDPPIDAVLTDWIMPGLAFARDDRYLGTAGP